jgi:hypothetical protein
MGHCWWGSPSLDWTGLWHANAPRWTGWLVTVNGSRHSAATCIVLAASRLCRDTSAIWGRARHILEYTTPDRLWGINAAPCGTDGLMLFGSELGGNVGQEARPAAQATAPRRDPEGASDGSLEKGEQRSSALMKRGDEVVLQHRAEHEAKVAGANGCRFPP